MTMNATTSVEVLVLSGAIDVREWGWYDLRLDNLSLPVCCMIGKILRMSGDINGTDP